MKLSECLQYIFLRRAYLDADPGNRAAERIDELMQAEPWMESAVTKDEGEWGEMGFGVSFLPVDCDTSLPISEMFEWMPDLLYDEKEALFELVSNEDFCRNALQGLAYVTNADSEENRFPYSWQKRYAAGKWFSDNGMEVNLDYFERLVNKLEIQAMKRVHKSVWEDNFLTALCLIARLKGSTVLTDVYNELPSEAAKNVFQRVAMKFCDRERTFAMIEQLLDSGEEKFENMLFHSLWQVDYRGHEELLERVCDTLLRKTMGHHWSAWEVVLGGCNANLVVDCVDNRFAEAVRKKSLDFCFERAKIQICAMEMAGECSEHEVLRMILEEEDPGRTLGLAMLSVMLDRKIECDERVRFWENGNFAKVLRWLIQALEEYRPVCYDLAGRAAVGMIENRMAPPSCFNRAGIIRASVEALQYDEDWRYAGELLALLPIHGGIPFQMSTDQCEILRTLGDKLERAFNNQSSDSPVVTFGAFAKLGGYEGNTFKLAFGFARVVRYYAQNPLQFRKMGIQRMEIMLENFRRENLSLPDVSSAVDPKMLGEPLSVGERDDLELFAKEIGEPRGMSMYARNCSQVLMILKYLEEKGPDNEKARILAEKMELWRAPVMGSYLITRCFYMLCAMNVPKQALIFYRCYRDVLDRAAVYPFERLNMESNCLENYVGFFRSISRAQQGILFSLGGGTGVMEAFLEEFPEVAEDIPWMLELSDGIPEEIIARAKGVCPEKLSGDEAGMSEGEINCILRKVKWCDLKEPIRLTVPKFEELTWRDFYDDDTFRQYLTITGKVIPR